MTRRDKMELLQLFNQFFGDICTNKSCGGCACDGKNLKDMCCMSKIQDLLEDYVFSV